MKSSVIWLVVFLIIVAVGVAVRQQLMSVVRSYLKNEAPTQAASDGPLIASGFIEIDDILISSELPGRVQALYVEEGDPVTVGEVLAQLDTSLLDGQIRQAEAALHSAETELMAVTGGARPEEIAVGEAAVAIAKEGVSFAERAVELAQGNVAAAQATLQAAQAELARVRAGPDSYELALAELQLELAQQRIPAIRAVRDSIGGNVERGELPEGSYEAAKAALAEAEIQARLAQSQLEALKAGPRQEDLDAAQAAVDAAQAGVDAARAQVVEAQQQLEAAQSRLRQVEARLELTKAGATSEEIAVIQAKVNGARARLRVLQVQRDKATLRAPCAGIVLERIVNTGERVFGSSIMFRLANLDRVQLTVYVPESELARVQLGQGVIVSVDSYPGREFQGQVVHIASRAEFTPRSIQTKDQRASQVYAVKIEILNPDHILKVGMSADAIFR